MNVYKDSILTVHLSRQETIAAIQLYVKTHTGEVLHIPDEPDNVRLAMGTLGHVALALTVTLTVAVIQ
jgi:hypothetical protein